MGGNDEKALDAAWADVGRLEAENKALSEQLAYEREQHKRCSDQDGEDRLKAIEKMHAAREAALRERNAIAAWVENEALCYGAQTHEHALLSKVARTIREGAWA